MRLDFFGEHLASKPAASEDQQASGSGGQKDYDHQQ
jgi:hypothetical protein